MTATAQPTSLSELLGLLLVGAVIGLIFLVDRWRHS